MQVRAISLHDLESFYDLFCEVNGEGLFSSRATPPPKHAVARALAQVVANDWPLYVIEQDGVILASAEAYPESFCCKSGSPLIGVLGMQVKHGYRRRGYGALLLHAVIEHGKRLGFEAIELTVLKSNAAARALYDKVGFAWVEDLLPCVLPSGQEDQLEKMRLGLARDPEQGPGYLQAV
ncbi:hypothetical protein PS910_01747 [Pseudomonas fluorescens]|nr:hypothetical protein PS910_01747 [Pseudomonas fluorescens]